MSYSFLPITWVTCWLPVGVNVRFDDSLETVDLNSGSVVLNVPVKRNDIDGWLGSVRSVSLSVKPTLPFLVNSSGKPVGALLVTVMLVTVRNVPSVLTVRPGSLVSVMKLPGLSLLT